MIQFTDEELLRQKASRVDELERENERLNETIDAMLDLFNRSQPKAGPATEYEAWDQWHKDREALVFDLNGR